MAVKWKKITTNPNYSVSSTGLVRNDLIGKLLKQSTNQKGYKRVSLAGDTKRQASVHTLVLEAFVGLKPIGLQCGHRDGNSSNNNVENLGWITAKENNEDKRRHGTLAVGDNHGKSKLSKRDVLCIISEYKRFSYGKSNTKLLAEKYGVDRGTIQRVVRGKYWKHIKLEASDE